MKRFFVWYFISNIGVVTFEGLRVDPSEPKVNIFLLRCPSIEHKRFIFKGAILEPIKRGCVPSPLAAGVIEWGLGHSSSSVSYQSTQSSHRPDISSSGNSQLHLK